MTQGEADGKYQVPLEAYNRLAKATPEEKTDIVLRLIEEHPEGRLELPERDGVCANLSEVDLSRDTLKARVDRVKVGPPRWWDANFQGAFLSIADLRGARLAHAKLQGANLAQANLENAYLHRVNLQGSQLQSVKFQGAKLDRADLQGASLIGAEFQGPGTDLSFADLRNAYLTVADLQGANQERAKLQRADLQGTILQDANLRGAELQGVDLSSATMTHVHIFGAWLDRTRLRWEQLGGAIGEELAGDYGAAKHGYLILKQNFESLGDYDAASRAYRKERQMEKATKTPWRCRDYYGHEEPFPRSMRGLFGRLWPNFRQYGLLPRWNPLAWWFWFKCTTMWLTDWFVELLCGYGESIRRVLFWMAAVLFGFAAYYSRIGGVWLVDPVSGPQATATSFCHYLIYSAGALTTTEFARFQAADDRVRLITAFQAMLGIILAGLLGFVLANRIRRS